jgi:hypothetical protein
VTDENNNEHPEDVPESDAARRAGAPTEFGRYGQRNLANRLFPGPSRQMSEQQTEHIDGLLKSFDADTIKSWRERKASPRSPGVGARPPRSASPDAGPTVRESAAPLVAETAQVGEKLEEQNELLRAILASSVDTQSDARATAQNSRTFAWAGTAIALLTLIATVISIVAAIRA